LTARLPLSAPWSASIAAAFGASHLPRVALDRLKGPLKKCVVDHVAFSVFTVHDPLALAHMSKSGVGGDRARLLTLFRVHKKGPASTKSVHGL